MHHVTGTAPEAAVCEVVVEEAGSGRLVAHEPVKGAFVVAYVAPGVIAPKVNIVANCRGRVVRRFASVSPRRSAELELGHIEP